jgi:hypothetical protein
MRLMVISFWQALELEACGDFVKVLQNRGGYLWLQATL